MNYQYVLMLRSSAFLLPWISHYAFFPKHRTAMWRTRLAMMPFGITEPRLYLNSGIRLGTQRRSLAINGTTPSLPAQCSQQSQ